MKKNIMGKPQALKQVNLSLVRKVIQEKCSATRAEIAGATNISATTVRTLLTEMLKNQEIVEAGCDESNGGRKAVRYRLNKNRFFFAALCLDGETVRYITGNSCGEIFETGSFAARKDLARSVCSFLDSLFEKMEIRAIGLGVPGIVSGLEYQRMNAGGVLERHAIGDQIRQRYGVPVILENDINAITLGFGRCYLKQFPEEICEETNIAYIHFDRDCISAGFLAGGRILRGWNNFVGELGLFPVDGSTTLDALLASPIDGKTYAQTVVKLLAGVCCVLNPQYIAVGGSGFRREQLPLIVELFSGALPREMTAEIVYAKDKWLDYYEGMAYLTARQIFADIRLIKE